MLTLSGVETSCEQVTQLKVETTCLRHIFKLLNVHYNFKGFTSLPYVTEKMSLYFNFIMILDD